MAARRRRQQRRRPRTDVHSPLPSSFERQDRRRPRLLFRSPCLRPLTCGSVGLFVPNSFAVETEPDPQHPPPTYGQLRPRIRVLDGPVTGQMHFVVQQSTSAPAPPGYAVVSKLQNRCRRVLRRIAQLVCWTSAVPGRARRCGVGGAGAAASAAGYQPAATTAQLTAIAARAGMHHRERWRSFNPEAWAAFSRRQGSALCLLSADEDRLHACPGDRSSPTVRWFRAERAISSLRARATRDRMVPMGHSQISAVWL